MLQEVNLRLQSSDTFKLVVVVVNNCPLEISFSRFTSLSRLHKRRQLLQRNHYVSGGVWKTSRHTKKESIIKMGFSSAVAALILFACISQMRPAVGGAMVLKIPGPKFDVEQKVRSEKFKLRISERGAKFDEKIELDKKKDIEYFKVPPHNNLSETDNMYDFKMNITVSRVKKDRVCHISPLPPDLPRPNVLSQGLKKLSNLPPSHNIEKITQQWRVGHIVDKKILRPEVRDFCGQFPVYRLEPFTPDAVSVVAGDEGNIGVDRKRRQVRDFILCDNVIPPCNPNNWVFHCQIATSRCVYYIPCILDQQNQFVSCSTLTKHLYSSIVCCKPRCS